MKTWLEEHRDEALERIEVTAQSLPNWIKLYAKALKHLHDEYDNDEYDDDEGSNDGSLNFNEV